MKNQLIALLLSGITLTSAAQDKKPAPFSFGIGYGINFLGGGGFSPTQNVNLSVWLPKNFEVTFPLTFGYRTNLNEQYDSILTNTRSGIRYVNRTRGNTTKSFSFAIAPGFNYHFPIKSNLDCYLGVSIPIDINTTLSFKTYDELSADNFNSKRNVETKFKPTVNAFGQLIFGCNYFFYSNLCLGARLLASYSFYKSSNSVVKTITTYEDSGSDNFVQGTSMIKSEVKPNYKYANSSFGFDGGGGFYLTYYFGMKKDKKESTN